MPFLSPSFMKSHTVTLSFNAVNRYKAHKIYHKSSYNACTRAGYDTRIKMLGALILLKKRVICTVGIDYHC